MVSYIPFITLFVLALCQPSNNVPPQDVVIPSGFPSGAPSMDCEVLQITRSTNEDDSLFLELQDTEVNHNQWWSNDEKQVSVFFDGSRWNVRADSSAALKSEQTAFTTPPSGTYVFVSFEQNTAEEEVPTWDLIFSCDNFFEENSSFEEYSLDDSLNVNEDSISFDDNLEYIQFELVTWENSDCTGDLISETKDEGLLYECTPDASNTWERVECFAPGIVGVVTYSDVDCVNSAHSIRIVSDECTAEENGTSHMLTWHGACEPENNFSSQNSDFSDEADFGTSSEADFDPSDSELESSDNDFELSNDFSAGEVALYMQICDCVVKHDLCDGTCLDMFNYEDQECVALMADGICGEGQIPTDMPYSELCGFEYCPMSVEDSSSDFEFSADDDFNFSDDVDIIETSTEEFESSDVDDFESSDNQVDSSDNDFDSSLDEFESSNEAVDFSEGEVTSDDDDFDFSDDVDNIETSTDEFESSNADDFESSDKEFESSEADDFESSDEEFYSSDEDIMTTTVSSSEPTPTTTTTTLVPTAISSEPTSVPTSTSTHTPTNEPALVLVKTKLEFTVTREEFQAEKEKYVEVFAASAGVDKSAVTMYLVGEEPSRRALEKRDLLEALQVICDILTATPEAVEEAVVSTDFVQEFNEKFDMAVLQRVAETVVITQAPTPQPTPASDSVSAVASGSNGGGMFSVVLVSVAVILALCAVAAVYSVRGRISPKVVVVKGSSLMNVIPENSLSVLYDETEGDVETSTKRCPVTTQEGTNWPRELYRDITREGEGITGDMENML